MERKKVRVPSVVLGRRMLSMEEVESLRKQREAEGAARRKELDERLRQWELEEKRLVGEEADEEAEDSLIEEYPDRYVYNGLDEDVDEEGDPG